MDLLLFYAFGVRAWSIRLLGKGYLGKKMVYILYKSRVYSRMPTSHPKKKSSLHSFGHRPEYLSALYADIVRLRCTSLCYSVVSETRSGIRFGLRITKRYIRTKVATYDINNSIAKVPWGVQYGFNNSIRYFIRERLFRDTLLHTSVPQDRQVLGGFSPSKKQVRYPKGGIFKYQKSLSESISQKALSTKTRASRY